MNHELSVLKPYLANTMKQKNKNKLEQSKVFLMEEKFMK